MTLERLVTTNIFSKAPGGVQREYVPFNEALTAQAFAHAINKGEMSVEEAWRHFWSYYEDKRVCEGSRLLPKWTNMVAHIFDNVGDTHSLQIVDGICEGYLLNLESPWMFGEQYGRSVHVNPCSEDYHIAMAIAATKDTTRRTVAEGLLERLQAHVRAKVIDIDYVEDELHALAQLGYARSTRVSEEPVSRLIYPIEDPPEEVLREEQVRSYAQGIIAQAYRNLSNDVPFPDALAARNNWLSSHPHTRDSQQYSRSDARDVLFGLLEDKSAEFANDFMLELQKIDRDLFQRIVGYRFFDEGGPFLDTLLKWREGFHVTESDLEEAERFFELCPHVYPARYRAAISLEHGRILATIASFAPEGYISPQCRPIRVHHQKFPPLTDEQPSQDR